MVGSWEAVVVCPEYCSHIAAVSHCHKIKPVINKTGS